ncbi:hypothetical protein [Granulicoccus phenolivorans]|uniref:hypothetical protein n=1 Tax=Granulicoccus phenolivorans TaxID=266854 RepID=UPI0004169CF9|nr:hypothetical protein [Granulicoccus phenolivorans]
MSAPDQPRRYIVTAHDLPAAVSAAQAAGAVVGDRMDTLGIFVITATAEIAARVAQSPAVSAVEPEGEMTTQ